jgi:hypothetical protein
MNIVAYAIGELSEDPKEGLRLRNLRADDSWHYKRMLGLSVMSVSRYLEDYDEIRIVNAGTTDWHTLLKRRFYFVKQLCLEGHTVFLCDADIMLLKRWRPPWEIERVMMWQPAPCPCLSFEGLGPSHPKGEFMMCCPSVFPPGKAALWEQATIGFENAMKVSERHHLEQIAYNFMYHTDGGDPKKDTDLTMSYNTWAADEGGWDPEVPESAATWYHALGTRSTGVAWGRMKRKAKEIGLL